MAPSPDSFAGGRTVRVRRWTGLEKSSRDSLERLASHLATIFRAQASPRRMRRFGLIRVSAPERAEWEFFSDFADDSEKQSAFSYQLETPVSG
jgi:hypothetical protein